MAGRLDGTVALVTGASSGIGEATALGLAAEGAAVAVAARRRDRLEALVERMGASAQAAVVEVDLTDEASARAMVERTVGELGRLDILINNAGVMLLGPIVDAPVEEWQRMVGINLLGLLYATHAALPHLLQAAESEPRRVADIVNVSSVAGRVARQGSGVYNATKFGVVAFTESLRQEVTRRHVRGVGGRARRGDDRAGRPQPTRNSRRDALTVRRHRADAGGGHRRVDRVHRLPSSPCGRQRGADPAHRAGALVPDPDERTGHFIGDLGVDTEVLAPGRAVTRMGVSPAVTAADGGVRAGVLATLVDVVGGVAAVRLVGPDWAATADLTIQIVQPLRGPMVEARGTVVRKGRTTLVVEAGVYDEPDGDPGTGRREPGPAAWATMTFAILPSRSPAASGDVPAVLADRFSVTGRGFDRPIVDALSISVTNPATGAVSMPVSEYLHNSVGAVQGGAMALVGEVAGGAALAAAGPGPEPVVRDLRLTYLTLGRVGPIVSRVSVLQAPDGPTGGTALVELLDAGADHRLTTVVQVGASEVCP